MKLSQFDYHLPKELIAQKPVRPRDSSRLLVYNRKTNKIIHDYFYNLGRYLKPSDVLVLNNSKVFPARLWGRKETGGKIEVLLLKKVKDRLWEVLIGDKGRGIGLEIKFAKGLSCQITKKLPAGVWQVKFNFGGKKFESIINKIGVAPTPPYIKQGVLGDNKGYQGLLREQYQTVYAKKVGSVAAPTAGFHFTKKLINKLKKQGIQFEYVTLHVGYGTFQPVKVEEIEKHKMHPEYVEVYRNTNKRLVEAKKQGRRIMAVGTTSVRVLESVYGLRTTDYSPPGFRGWVNTFIYPGYCFKFVDAMITNFHLPKSTLLMLVSAFVGRKNILKIYKQAIKKKYRFYSFGDAMLIL